jgi:hypothetical protein
MNKLLQFALDNPGTTSWHISPTMQDARAAYSAAAITLAEQVRKTQPDRSLVLNNGSVVAFLVNDSGNLYVRLLGHKPNAVQCDRTLLGEELLPLIDTSTVIF